MIEKLCVWISSKMNGITIPVNGVSYLSRFYFFLKDRKYFNVWLHHFHSSDQHQQLHSHPFRFGLAFVLFGGYTEEKITNQFGKITTKLIKPFTFNLISSSDFHRVDLMNETKGAWTIFITGPRLFKDGKPDWCFIDRDSRKIEHWTSNPEAIP